MIVEKIDRTLEMSADFEEFEFGMDAEDMGHIFEVLSNPYGNAVKAVIREYSTNARDEHVKLGKADVPFKVTLPTQFEPTFKIRDYGSGLSHEEIKTVYTRYGKSTKRNSNDFNGQIGIGCKSGFAYGDQTFTVTSYLDGKVESYTCLLNAEGKPAAIKLYEAETEEPNGIEITIPVKPFDINRYRQEAINVYRYFSVKPEFVGGVIAASELERPKAMFNGSNWNILGKGESYVVMGEVAYPLDHKQFEDNSAISNLIQSGLDIEMPIGDIAMTISREAIKYTPATKAKLTTTLKEIVEELAKQVSDKFASAKDLWEAKSLYRKVFNEYGILSSRLPYIVGNKVTWQGIPITGNTFTINYKGMVVRSYRENWKNNAKLSSSRAYDIKADPKNVVVINDLGNKTGSPSRLAELHKTNPYEYCYLITFNDDEGKKKFYDEHHFDKVPVLYLSKLPKPAVVKTANAKHALKCFVFDRNVSYGASSAFWVGDTIDFENGKGYYVTLNRFDVSGNYPLSPYGFQNLLTTLSDAGITIPPIYGIKESALVKKPLGSGWIPFWDYVKEQMAEALKKDNLLETYINNKEVNEKAKNSYLHLKAHKDKFKADSPLSKLIKAVEEMTPKDSSILNKADKIVRLMNRYNIKLTAISPKHNIAELVAEVDKTYPLFKYISESAFRNEPESVIQYVKCVDGA